MIVINRYHDTNNRSHDTYVTRDGVIMQNIQAIHVFATPILMTLILRQNDQNITITNNDEDIRFDYHTRNISIIGLSNRQNIGLRLNNYGHYISDIQTFKFEHYHDNVLPEITISLVPIGECDRKIEDIDEQDNNLEAFSKHEVILDE